MAIYVGVWATHIGFGEDDFQLYGQKYYSMLVISFIPGDNIIS